MNIVHPSCSPRGVFRMTPERRSRMRRPRARLVTSRSGGLGSPSAPTRRGCLKWLDAVGMKESESSPDEDGLRAGQSQPGRTGPRTEIAADGAPGGAFPPIARRKGDASQASRAVAPTAQEADRKASAFPGAPLPSLRERGFAMTAYPAPDKEYGRWRAPEPHCPLISAKAGIQRRVSRPNACCCPIHAGPPPRGFVGGMNDPALCNLNCTRAMREEPGPLTIHRVASAFDTRLSASPPTR